MTEPAEHLADVLDGRSVPADAATRAMANLAAGVVSLPLATEPAGGWSRLDEHFSRIITGKSARKWYEGWGLGGRPRPLVQRLAAGVMLAGIAGGAGSAATGVTPGEALDAVGDATAGIVRYVVRDDGGPGPLTEAPGAVTSTTPVATPSVATTSPASGSTPNSTPPPASTPAPTTSAGAPATASSPPTTTTYAAGEAGTVTPAFNGTTLALVSTQPAAGWTASGDEDDDIEKVEVTFTSGDRQVEFKAEAKDGAVSVETSGDGEDD